MDVSRDQLKERDAKLMVEEKYESVASYFDIRLKGFAKLKDKGLIDKVIDGHRSTEEIAQDIVQLVKNT